MTWSDRILVCADCGAAFAFTVGEQEFHLSLGFRNDPARCPDCRALRKAGRRPGRPWSRVTCPECGQPAEVPFRPVEGRPVLCRACYLKPRPGRR